jgi:hypothetical protein
MDMVYLVYLYAIAVGFVAAGVTESVWALATGESPRFGLLLEPGVTAPLRALVVVASAPLLLLLAAWRFVGNVIVGTLLIVASLGWSFLQGAFILTQIFGAS